MPGLADLAGRSARFAELLDALRAHPAGGRDGTYRVGAGRVGAGRVVVAADDTDLNRALAGASAAREPVADSGLRVLRRRHAEGWHYVLANVTARRVDGWFPLGTAAERRGRARSAA